MTIESSTADSGISLIKQVGFPVVVALWFMLRNDKKMDDQNKVLGEIVALVKRLEDKI